MNLIVPAPGVTAGPAYANDQNASFQIIDQHNHTSGNGVQIPPSGLNINAALTFQNNPATNLQATVFTPQASSTTLDAVYVKGVDLYYNDGSGNVIQLTSGGSVNATSSGISSGTNSASFVSNTLVVNSASSTPANIQVGSVLVGNNISGSKFVTVQPTNSLAANYSLTLPLLPASTLFMTLDTSGNIGTSTSIQGSQIATGSLVGTQLANNTITRAQEASVGQQVSSSSGTFTTTNSSPTDVTNLTVTITTSGRPVMLFLQSDGTSGVANISTSSSTLTNRSSIFLVRGSTTISTTQLSVGVGSNVNNSVATPPGLITFLDAPSAGTYTYKAQVANGSFGAVAVSNCVLVAYEL